jgi:hypothetical protein
LYGNWPVFVASGAELPYKCGGLGLFEVTVRAECADRRSRRFDRDLYGNWPVFAATGTELPYKCGGLGLFEVTVRSECADRRSRRLERQTAPTVGPGA